MATPLTSGFVPHFTLSGGTFLVRNYGITASAEWDVGDCVLEGGAGTVDEGADAGDITGVGMEAVGNLTTGQSDSDELRPYLFAVTGQKVTPVAIFDRNTVWRVDDVTDSTEGGSAVLGDVGLNADIQLVTTWGIDADDPESASVPNVAIIDIEPIRGLWIVVATTRIADQFTFLDQSV